MTASKIINELLKTTTRDPHKEFADLGAIIVSVPKSEADKRDKEWQKAVKPRTCEKGRSDK